jgi:cell division inhibitor SepF
MPQGFRKMAVYLGLVEDNQNNLLDEEIEEFYEEELPVAPVAPRWSPTPRTFSTNGSTALAEKPEVRMQPQVRVQAQPQVSESISRITTLHPRAFNDARRIGEEYRDGTPVIINLSEMEPSDQKRILDFASGLAFALRGTIERVTSSVFLISPANVDLGAEARQQVEQDGFFNQV